MNRIERIEQMLATSPDDSFLLFALGLEEIKIGNTIRAKELFLKIVATNPDYSGVYYHLGKLFESENNQEEAIKTYETGMSICKRLSENHNYRELQAALENLIY